MIRLSYSVCRCPHFGQKVVSKDILAPHLGQYFTSEGLGGAASGAFGRGASSLVESCLAEIARGKHAVTRPIIPEIPRSRKPKNIIQIEFNVILGNPYP